MNVQSASKTILAILLSCSLLPVSAQDEAPRPSLDVHWVPTPDIVVEEMLRLAEVDSDDVVYDLGSGDGRIVITAARQYGARGVGIDLDPERIADSRANAEAAGVADRVQFIQGDLFATDLSEATAVTLYLLNSLNRKLRPKLLRELRPGTPVVSHAFDMGEWEPEETRHVGSSVVYKWTIPAKVGGEWEFQIQDGQDSEKWSARLEQQFQSVSGLAVNGGDQALLEDGRVKGATVEFVLITNENGIEQRQRFSGVVQGDVIVGTLVDVAGGDSKKWTARRLDATSHSERHASASFGR